MLDPQRQAELDQAIAMSRELWGPALRSIYDSCIDQGFTVEQALEFAKVWLSQTVANTKA